MDLTSLQPHQKQFIPGANSFVTQQQQMSDQNNGHYKQMSQPALMPQLISNHQQTQPAQQQQLSFHRPSRSVVHVRENSIDELDALFDPSKWSLRKTNNLPLTKRNLPQSFFKPPETGGTKTPKLINSNQHSRQNSIDQTNMLNHSNLLNQQHLLVQQKLNNLNGSPLNNNNNTGLPVLQSHLSSNFHTRSISEPVAAALSPFNVNQTQFNQQQQQQQQQQQHHHHQLAKNNQQIQTNPNVLPYGWRTAKTQQGQRYFINYITKQTSWTIPTQAVTNSSSLSYYDQAQNNQIENFISSSSSTSSSPVLNLTNMNNPSDIDLNNLNNPHHMSSGINTHLNIDVKNDCMLNSNSNSIGLSTLSSSTSASVSASDDDLIAEFQQNQQLELQQQLEKLENQQQLEFILNQIQMPSGWEKAQTAKGEVYFINHNTKSTYWEDPRIALIPNFLKQKKLKITTNRGNQQNEITNLNNQNNNMLSPFNTSNLIFNGPNPTSSSNLINNSEVNIELTNNNNSNNETGFENVQTNQIDIKSLIVEVINKKKELFRSLEDLNKQESFLRAQLNAAFSNCSLPAGLNSSSNEFSLNFEENFDCMETSNKTGENINSFSNGIVNDLNVNDKLNPIQSSKSVSSSSSPSSIASLMSNSSNNSNNMSYYQNALKSNNLENYNNLFQPNNSNSESCLSNNNNINDIKISRKNQNGENLLSIIKTESVNPQITDQLDAVSSLYNKLLINNGQNAQFQIEQNTLINNSSMQNKIIDFI